jgi:hypothetical protein
MTLSKLTLTHRGRCAEFCNYAREMRRQHWIQLDIPPSVCKIRRAVDFSFHMSFWSGLISATGGEDSDFASRCSTPYANQLTAKNNK